MDFYRKLSIHCIELNLAGVFTIITNILHGVEGIVAKLQNFRSGKLSSKNGCTF